jgi:uncharacterized protein YdhG (YjbR/CyaY superfamily)
MDKKIITTIDEYISSFPKNVQKILREIKRSLREAAPEAEEAISYQIPTFKLNGNLVHFAAFKNHIGFYPGSKAIKIFSKELESYETSKGTVRFPLDKPMPLLLIKKIVRYRVKESSTKVKKKK